MHDQNLISGVFSGFCVGFLVRDAMLRRSKSVRWSIEGASVRFSFDGSTRVLARNGLSVQFNSTSVQRLMNIGTLIISSNGEVFLRRAWMSPLRVGERLQGELAGDRSGFSSD